MPLRVPCEWKAPPSYVTREYVPEYEYSIYVYVYMYSRIVHVNKSRVTFSKCPLKSKRGFEEGENLRDSVGLEKQLNNVRYDWQGPYNIDNRLRCSFLVRLVLVQQSNCAQKLRYDAKSTTRSKTCELRYVYSLCSPHKRFAFS